MRCMSGTGLEVLVEQAGGFAPAVAHKSPEIDQFDRRMGEADGKIILDEVGLKFGRPGARADRADDAACRGGGAFL